METTRTFFVFCGFIRFGSKPVDNSKMISVGLIRFLGFSKCFIHPTKILFFCDSKTYLISPPITERKYTNLTKIYQNSSSFSETKPLTELIYFNSQTKESAF